MSGPNRQRKGLQSPVRPATTDKPGIRQPCSDAVSNTRRMRLAAVWRLLQAAPARGPRCLAVAAGISSSPRWLRGHVTPNSDSVRVLQSMIFTTPALRLPARREATRAPPPRDGLGIDECRQDGSGVADCA